MNKLGFTKINISCSSKHAIKMSNSQLGKQTTTKKAIGKTYKAFVSIV